MTGRGVALAVAVGVGQSCVTGVAVAFASLAGSAEPAEAWRAAFVQTAGVFAAVSAVLVVPCYVVVALLGAVWVRRR
jgi:hypothetical protein